MSRAAVEPSGSGRARPTWPAPRTAYAVAALARNGLPLIVLIAIAPLLAARSWLLPWMLMPPIGILIYRLSNVMHDCGHRTLFKSARANDRVGRLLGAVTGIDFRSFTRAHWQHHRVYGQANDPQGFHYLGLADATPAVRFRRVLEPLCGLHLRYALPESALAPRNLQRTVASGEIWLIVAVQGALMALATGFGAHPALAVLPAASGATFGLFASQLRGIAEHAVLDEAVEAGSVRSHAPHWLDRVLLYDVNFNYHAEHHSHPECPSCHLPALQRQAGNARLAPSMFGTIAAAIRGRRQQVV